MMKTLFSLLLLLITTCSLYSQIITEVPKLPSYIPNSNFGTEFYLSSLPAITYCWHGCWNCAFLFSEFETEVSIVNLRNGLKNVYKLEPNKYRRIDFTKAEVIPYIPLSGSNPSPDTVERVYPKSSLYISSDKPICVNFKTDTYYSSDVFSVLPTSSWGKEYVVNTYYSHNNYVENNVQFNIASTSMVLAGFDSTIVEFIMIGNSNSITKSGIEFGKTSTFLMNKGDLLPIATKLGLNSTLTSSRIIANKPIGVISGVECANVPVDIYPCDNLVEMELPVHTWGKTFHITKNINRNIGYLFQVVAKDTNTTLSVNGMLLKVLQKNDTTQFVEWAEFNRFGNEFTDNNFVLSADKPISVTLFNQSASIDSSNIDSYQMVLTPVEQYRNEISGFCFNTFDQSGYRYNFINVIYPLDSNLKMPEYLQWGESNGDTMVWVPFNEKWGDTTDYVFEGMQDGKKYAAKFLTLKNETIYQIRCSENIAAYAYGHNSYDAYGVPAFLGLRDLTVQDSLPPKFDFVQTADGSIVGKNPNEKAMITDLHHPLDSSSKLSMVYNQFSNTVNYDVQIDRFIPGDDATTSFTASVIDKSKDAQCVITAIDRAGNDTTILITQKATISTVDEAESTKFLKVTPSITNNVPISIEITNAGESLSIVSIDGRTIHTFENLSKVAGSQKIQFETTSLPIGMYYVLYTVNGKQYQQSFVKMK